MTTAQIAAHLVARNLKTDTHFSGVTAFIQGGAREFRIDGGSTGLRLTMCCTPGRQDARDMGRIAGHMITTDSIDALIASAVC